MAFLAYEYKMKIRYSQPVVRCYFTLKSLPAEDFRQRSISHEIRMTPNTRCSKSVDSFGNAMLIGGLDRPHSEFDYRISGMVETQATAIIRGIDDRRLGMYKYPHGKCIPGDRLKAFAGELERQVETCGSGRDKCRYIMDLLSRKMVYEAGSTGIDTPAEEAFAGGRGVCQDYAHIFITLLRRFGIPARYVCGLIVGEGQSHAWVEAACDGHYLAFDPTHNREITDEYIKLGCGRDAADCAINRGVMWGGGQQTQEIRVTVERYY